MCSTEPLERRLYPCVGARERRLYTLLTLCFFVRPGCIGRDVRMGVAAMCAQEGLDSVVSLRSLMFGE